MRKIHGGHLILQSMNETKPILAIETSENICGACVYFSDSKYFESVFQLKNSHAEKLFETIDYVINSANVKVDDLGSIAVSSGPGSFTGLRIGMSAAKGIAFGASLPIIPVPTFEALAMQISMYLPSGSLFAIANKVNTDEIYFAKFKAAGNVPAPDNGNLLDKSNNFIFVENLTIINSSGLLKQTADCLVFGNAGGISNSNETKKLIISAPHPVFVARWASLKGSELMKFDFDYLEPDYLKNFIAAARVPHPATNK
jgi:tRNA threonylcarbamoyladenosine biosynthesis protein TsaB